MGTRSIVSVMDGNQELVRIYRQYDGYPEGMGVDLARALQGVVITNGISHIRGPGGENEYRGANGMEELGALLVMRLKQESPVGNVYLNPPGESLGEDSWIEYVYRVTGKEGEAPRIECATTNYSWPFNMQEKTAFVFAGTPDEWISKYRESATS